MHVKFKSQTLHSLKILSNKTNILIRKNSIFDSYIYIFKSNTDTYYQVPVCYILLKRKT